MIHRRCSNIVIPTSGVKKAVLQPRRLGAWIRGRPIPARYEDTEYLFSESLIPEKSLRRYLNDLNGDKQLEHVHKRSIYELGNSVDRPIRCIGLYVLVRHFSPTVVVETGCLHGHTSSYILSALKKNNHGHLYTIDVHPNDAGYDPDLPRGFVPGWIVPHEFSNLWTLHIEKVESRLPKLLSELESPVDLFYHDSDHTPNHKIFEIEQILTNAADDVVIAADDVGHDNFQHPSTAIPDVCERLGAELFTSREFIPGDDGPSVFGFFSLN